MLVASSPLPQPHSDSSCSNPGRLLAEQGAFSSSLSPITLKVVFAHLPFPTSIF